MAWYWWAVAAVGYVVCGFITSWFFHWTDDCARARKDILNSDFPDGIYQFIFWLWPLWWFFIGLVIFVVAVNGLFQLPKLAAWFEERRKEKEKTNDKQEGEVIKSDSNLDIKA